ncbi:CaiB/BaiF CoA transferase family protein [Timonella senegalensis]|uniref:CaiB/BaiF CoA transferase family protein n=1 Tax=Timonella senegalensis TaxID=1465825 RepID=UPI000302198A|nr:CoA transferase [Timonella senegalensis]
MTNHTLPLSDIVVLDVSTLFAGPMAAMHLGDAGARVIKVEHTLRPDPSRGHGAAKDGHNLWWKTLGRNKETIQIDLHSPEGQEVLKALVAKADVLIENFRPDTLEKWGIGYDVLAAVNPGLVMARITGFGQVGPYRRRPGFGTLAEAMSGFAASTGEPDGPPTLPPFGLADGIASLASAYAIMTALHARDVPGPNQGKGQMIDMAIVEPMLGVLGPQITRWDQLHDSQPRTGNRSANNAPRNTYKTADGKWVAVSTSAQSIAERVMTLVGRPDFIDQPWFATGAQRAQHADELDEAVGSWIAQRNRDEVVAAFEEAQAAIAAIYEPEDIVNDPQFQAIGTIRYMDDPDLGRMAMQGPLFRLSSNPTNEGAIRFTGRAPGQNTTELLEELGYSAEQIDALRQGGAVK